MVLAVMLSVVPLIWRRRAPLAVLVATEIGAGVYNLTGHAGPSQPIWYGAVIALFTLAAQGPRWQRLGALVFIAWGALLVTGSLATAARGTLIWLTAYALGRAWAGRGAQAEALRERARRLERDREWAAERERARIAREMHDVLGHGVAVMIAQAEAGPVFIGRDDARVEASFEAITVAGRDAMAQVRRILGLLAPADRPAPPAPTLAGLPALVSHIAATGVEVRLTDDVPAGSVSPSVEEAAYRIVQEALTNVLKHACGPGRPPAVTVELFGEGELLVVRVTDDGPGGDPAGGGHGLAGIRARAAAQGGEAEAGPREDGTGFRVTARLPRNDTNGTVRVPERAHAEAVVA